MKIRYHGDMKKCRINAFGTTIDPWYKGEVKDLEEVIANKILNDNKDFSLADDKDENPKKEKEKENMLFDLDGDGDFDKDDLSIAGKVMAEGRKKK